MHVSWRDNGFWIAGGVDHEGKHINEVWRYHERWELMNIFETDNAIVGNNDQGLLEIGFRVMKVAMKPNFSSLDGLFDRLILRQKEFSTSSCNDAAALEGMNEAHETLRTNVTAMEKYAESGDNEGVSGVLGFFSSKYRKMLAKQSETARNQLVALSSSVSSKYPEYIDSAMPRQSAELAFQLSLKQQQYTKDFERMKQERIGEINLQREHLGFLLKGKTTVSRLDPADFNTFGKITQSFSKAQQEFALNQFYRMQLREYHMLMEQTAKNKLRKMQSGQEKRTRMISRLSDELTTRFKVVTSAEETLNKWKRQLEVTQADVKKSHEFLEAISSFRNSNEAAVQRIESLQNENEKVRQRIQREAADISSHKRADFEFLKTKIMDLERSIHGKITDDSKAAIFNEYVKIKEVAERIVHKK